DSIYLKHYARIYGMAIYRSKTLKEIQMYYSALSFVTDTESVVRLNYLKQFGITDDDIELMPVFHENQNYIDFMVGVSENGELPEILMAIMPCMLSYCYIFKKIAAKPTARSSRYWDFISDYADEHFDEICLNWQAYADSLCDSLPAEKKDKLCAIFEKGSLLELDFWKMAYRGTANE
ncbi:MAG TPA: transcriptional regulator, partial [Ruminococcaceae bacterium]|nr:transcriptional regulator [Oscillospiraceae bacterium]